MSDRNIEIMTWRSQDMVDVDRNLGHPFHVHSAEKKSTILSDDTRRCNAPTARKSRLGQEQPRQWEDSQNCERVPIVVEGNVRSEPEKIRETEEPRGGDTAPEAFLLKSVSGSAID